MLITTAEKADDPEVVQKTRINKPFANLLVSSSGLYLRHEVFLRVFNHAGEIFDLIQPNEESEFVAAAIGFPSPDADYLSAPAETARREDLCTNVVFSELLHWLRHIPFLEPLATALASLLVDHAIYKPSPWPPRSPVLWISSDTLHAGHSSNSKGHVPLNVSPSTVYKRIFCPRVFPCSWDQSETKPCERECRIRYRSVRTEQVR